MMEEQEHKKPNPHLISIHKAWLGIGLNEENPNDREEIDGILMDSTVPACCDQGCEVEPDGKCEHGCPSVLIQLGVI